MSDAEPTADERLRDLAAHDDPALVAYERKWNRRLARLQRAHPGRWRVPGWSDEELRDELTLRLIAAVRGRPEQLAQFGSTGKEWGLAFLEAQRRELRRSFKLKVEPGDTSFALDRSASEEERLLDLEHEQMLALAGSRAELSLSRPQRRWLAALKMTANAGSFFEASGNLNLAAASRMLDKHRSSALRAFDELSRHYASELEKLR